MARFYFDLHECGTYVADHEGRDCAGLSAAFDQALDDARDIMGAEVRAGRLCLSCRIDILDERRQPVLTVPFSEALAITGR